jgi:hypothetical protein
VRGDVGRRNRVASPRRKALSQAASLRSYPGSLRPVEGVARRIRGATVDAPRQSCHPTRQGRAAERLGEWMAGGGCASREQDTPSLLDGAAMGAA